MEADRSLVAGIINRYTRLRSEARRYFARCVRSAGECSVAGQFYINSTGERAEARRDSSRSSKLPAVRRESFLFMHSGLHFGRRPTTKRTLSPARWRRRGVHAREANWRSKEPLLRAMKLCKCLGARCLDNCAHGQHEGLT